VHTDATVRINLLKDELGTKVRECDRNLYFQAHYKISIHWHHDQMKIEVKNPKTDMVMATKDTPYDND
jgi:hypothetical protein